MYTRIAIKQNTTINVLFVILCILLLGFVYLNTKMIDHFTEGNRSENVQPVDGTAPVK